MLLKTKHLIDIYLFIRRNRMNKCWILPLLFLIVINCTNDPDILISKSDYKAVVGGSVYPDSIRAKVSLVLQSDTVYSTWSDPGTGEFLFTDIPFGGYTIVASHGTWHGDEYIRIDEPFHHVYLIHMLYGGNYFRDIEPSAMSVLNASYIAKYPEFTLSLHSKSGTFVNNVTIASPAHLDTIKTVKRDSYVYTFSFPTEALLSCSTLSVAVNLTISGNSQSAYHDSLLLEYSIDTTGYDSILTHMSIRQMDPDFQNEDSFPCESPITILFNDAMHWQSVEENTTINPSVPLNFVWRDNVLDIIPSNSLTPLTRYTLTIDTGAMTIDSSHLRAPFHLHFTTGRLSFFTHYWPLHGAGDVPLNAPFEFYSSISLTAELLQAGFSITPDVDSLAFIEIEEGRIEIEHAPLLPDTTYQITIDSSLQSKKGAMLGKEFIIRFQTVTTGNP
ncbi:MAG: hypothetical protein GF401_04930 [Chitinivibrionales bacterium]|nr:hypothetical protein [Chitinivibrionales bacterium]